MIPPHEYVECHCPLLYSHCAICFQVEENCRRRNAEEKPGEVGSLELLLREADEEE